MCYTIVFQEMNTIFVSMLLSATIYLSPTSSISTAPIVAIYTACAILNHYSTHWVTLLDKQSHYSSALIHSHFIITLFSNIIFPSIANTPLSGTQIYAAWATIISCSIYFMLEVVIFVMRLFIIA